MTFVKNASMSSVNFFNSSILKVLYSEINDELEVFKGNGTSSDIVLGRDIPVVTNRRFQRVEQFFSFRETQERNLFSRFTNFKDKLVVKFK